MKATVKKTEGKEIKNCAICWCVLTEKDKYHTVYLRFGKALYMCNDCYYGKYQDEVMCQGEDSGD